jgi:hypothetical protein
MFERHAERISRRRASAPPPDDPGVLMTDPDTPSSVQGDAPSGQDPITEDAGASAPDPHEVKTQAAGSAAEKPNDQWVTGDEPMTGPQASYLETLAQNAGEEVPTGLTKAQASDEIERLQGEGGTPDPSNQERPTTDWVTGDEPMTGPQASYLETLAQQAGVEPPTGLNKSEASRAIQDLQAKARG